MESKKLQSAIIMFIVLIMAVWMVIEILLDPTSSVGRMYLYVTIFAGVFSVIRPQYGLYLVLPLTCYIDFFKRLMILPGVPTQIEVAYIMSMPSIIICGSVVGIWLAAAFGGAKIGRTGIISFLVALLILALSLIAGGDNSGIRGFGQALNQGVYAFLFFLVPLVLHTQEKRRNYLQWTFVAFIPVAIYMIKHFFFGLANFEYDYLLTGLSQEYRILIEDRGESPRYFSTMNGAATVSTMLSIMILLAFVPLERDGVRPTPQMRISKALVAILFAFAASLTLSRTGWICGMVAIGAYVLFGGAIRTSLFYVLAGLGFLIAVLSADFLIQYRILDDWERQIGAAVLAISDSPQMARAIQLGTMYDRLSGWSNLINHPEIFGLFGNKEAEMVTVGYANLKLGHDIIVIWLLKLGWIPMILLFSLLCTFTYRLHKFQFSLPQGGLDSRMVRLCLASAAGMLSGGMANGAQLLNFPQNFYFYLWLSVALATYLQLKEKARVAIPVAESEPLPAAGSPRTA